MNESEFSRRQFRNEIGLLNGIDTSLGTALDVYVQIGDMEEAGKLCEAVGAYRQARRFYQNSFDWTDPEYSPLKMALASGMENEVREDTVELIEYLFSEGGLNMTLPADYSKAGALVLQHFGSSERAIKMCEETEYFSVAGSIAEIAGQPERARQLFERDVKRMEALFPSNDWGDYLCAAAAAYSAGSARKSVAYFAMAAVARKSHGGLNADHDIRIFLERAINTARDNELVEEAEKLEALRDSGDITSNSVAAAVG